MAVGGYADTGPTDDELRDLVTDLLSLPSYVDERNVDTPMGRQKMRCATVTGLSHTVRARTGKWHTAQQLVERLERTGFTILTAYRGSQPMTVVLPRVSLRVVAGTDLRQTG